MDERLQVLLEVIGIESEEILPTSNFISSYNNNENETNDEPLESNDKVEEPRNIDENRESIVGNELTSTNNLLDEYSEEYETEENNSINKQEDLDNQQEELKVSSIKDSSYYDLDNQEEELIKNLQNAKETTNDILANFDFGKPKEEFETTYIAPDIQEYQKPVSRIDKEILQKEMLNKRIKVNNQKLSEEAFSMSYSAKQTILLSSTELELDIEDDLEPEEEVQDENKNNKKKGIFKRIFKR